MEPQCIILFVLFTLFSTLQNAGGVQCPTLFEYYPDLHDCSRFYRCVWGQTQPFSCPPGTLWEQTLLTCDHAEKVTCHATSSSSWNERFGHVGELNADTPDFSYAESPTWEHNVAFSSGDGNNAERDSESVANNNHDSNPVHISGSDFDYYHHYAHLGPSRDPWGFGDISKHNKEYPEVPYSYNEFYPGNYHQSMPEGRNTTEKINSTFRLVDGDFHRYQLFDSDHRQRQEKLDNQEHQKRKSPKDDWNEQETPASSDRELEWPLDRNRDRTLEDLHRQHVLKAQKPQDYEKGGQYRYSEEEQEQERIRKHQQQLQQHRRELEDHLEQVLALEEIQREFSEELRPQQSQDKDGRQTWASEALEAIEEQERKEKIQQALVEQERIKKHQQDLEQYEQELKQHEEQVKALEALQQRQEWETQQQQEQQQQQQLQLQEKKSPDKQTHTENDEQQGEEKRSRHHNKKIKETAIPRSQRHAEELQQHQQQVEILKELQKHYQEFQQDQKQRKDGRTKQQHENQQTEHQQYQKRYQEQLELLHELRDRYQFTPTLQQPRPQYQSHGNQGQLQLPPRQRQFINKIRVHNPPSKGNAEKSLFSAAMKPINHSVVDEKQKEQKGHVIQPAGSEKQHRVKQKEEREQRGIEDQGKDGNKDKGEEEDKAEETQPKENSYPKQQQHKQQHHSKHHKQKQPQQQHGEHKHQHQDNKQNEHDKQKQQLHLHEKDKKLQSQSISQVAPETKKHTSSIHTQNQAEDLRDPSHHTGRSSYPQRQHQRHHRPGQTQHHPNTFPNRRIREQTNDDNGIKSSTERHRLRQKPTQQHPSEKNPSQSRSRFMQILNQSNTSTLATENLDLNTSINRDLLLALLVSNSEDLKGPKQDQRLAMVHKLEEYIHPVDTTKNNVIGSVIGRETPVVEESIPWLMSDFFRAGYGYKRIYP